MEEKNNKTVTPEGLKSVDNEVLESVQDHPEGTNGHSHGQMHNGHEHHGAGHDRHDHADGHGHNSHDHGEEHDHSHSHEEHHHNEHDCCHHHDHDHEEGHHHHHHHDEASPKATIVKLVIAAVLLAAAYFIERKGILSNWQLLLVYLVPYLVVGFDTLKEAAEGLLHGEALDEYFLMSVATIGAMVIAFLPGGQPQFLEAVFVMLFYQIGELFEGIAEGNSRRSIEHLVKIRPDIAHLVDEAGERDAACEDITIGSVVNVYPGERIPLDGTVISGSSSVDTSAVTGESVPRSVTEGDEVYSACVNLNAQISIKVGKLFSESTASRILNLVENADQNKSGGEKFITRFARIYTPAVVIAAVLLATIPLLFGGSLSVWLYRALTFLIVSCPCALVISIPLSFFGGIGGASKKGILFKGSNYLEALADIDTLVADKTGTLTCGVFEVTAVHPEVIDSEELLHLAAHVERHSSHPIAASLLKAYPNEKDDCKVGPAEEIAGQGVKAQVGNRMVHVGNYRLMESIGAKWHPCHKSGSIVHVAIDGQYAGHIVISDKPKDDAQSAIAQLKKLGVKDVVMLTGDTPEVAAEVASELGIEHYYASLLPEDKVSKLRELQNSAKVAFVGDGINDAPVLATADVGIAMGGLGSDAAIEASDVVIMDDKPSKIATAINVARKTVRIARQNTWVTIAVKMLVLCLSAFGLASMGMAVFADVGLTVLAVLNAMRALR